MCGQKVSSLQLDINRDIDGASRDVQAAINAARADLPANLPNNPLNGPILVLALSSKAMTHGQICDVASTISVPRFAQSAASATSSAAAQHFPSSASGSIPAQLR